MRGDVPTDLLSFSRPDILKNPILHNYFIKNLFYYLVVLCILKTFLHVREKRCSPPEPGESLEHLSIPILSFCFLYLESTQNWIESSSHSDYYRFSIVWALFLVSVTKSGKCFMMSNMKIPYFNMKIPYFLDNCSSHPCE